MDPDYLGLARYYCSKANKHDHRLTVITQWSRRHLFDVLWYSNNYPQPLLAGGEWKGVAGILRLSCTIFKL